MSSPRFPHILLYMPPRKAAVILVLLGLLYAVVTKDVPGAVTASPQAGAVAPLVQPAHFAYTGGSIAMPPPDRLIRPSFGSIPS